MKELKIEVPNGYEIDKEKSTFEKIVFKELKRHLPKSWEELEEVSGFCTSSDSNVHLYELLSVSKNNKNIFATKEQAEASIALAQLSQLREVYRDGWEPNWENTSETKYAVHPCWNNWKVEEVIIYNNLLSFQSREIAQEFLDNFRDLIEQAKPLMS